MLIEVLRRAAAGLPEQPVMVSRERTLTYAGCVSAADAIGRGLGSRGVDRVGIALRDPADVLSVLAGASAAGVEACTYPRDLSLDEIARTASRFEHRFVVTDEAVSPQTAEALVLADLPEEGEPLPVPGSNPVMILTTGTTGDQKGVRHDWSRLIRAVRSPDPSPGSRWLLAYNLNQFAGVQVLLHAVASGATIVAPRSSQAHDAIDAMLTLGVTHVSATPTFWRLLAGGLDAATTREMAIEQITLGGEPSPGDLLEKLRGLFPDARISHVYAGTEVGSVVSVRDGLPGLPKSVLERGDDTDVQLRIVDGELQIRSRVGMLGYHGSQDAEGEWIPTGDLVEERGDRIHFVGRTTEIINVGGAKVHPLPIEDLVCSVEGVELAAAYGRPNPITGQIVALDVVAVPGSDKEALEAAIREACQSLPRPGRPRSITFVDELNLKGNKVLRRSVVGSGP